jgi:protein TonB
VPSASPSAPRSNAASDPGALAAYKAGLYARISSRQVFPVGAPSGTVTVHFVISRSGSLLSKQVMRTSGSELLDNEAMASVEREAPFPPFPDGLAGPRLEVTLPIRFRAH